jgi:hypothetical protein
MFQVRWIFFFAKDSLPASSVLSDFDCNAKKINPAPKAHPMSALVTQRFRDRPLFSALLSILNPPWSLEAQSGSNSYTGLKRLLAIGQWMNLSPIGGRFWTTDAAKKSSSFYCPVEKVSRWPYSYVQFSLEVAICELYRIRSFADRLSSAGWVSHSQSSFLAAGERNLRNDPRIVTVAPGAFDLSGVL